MDGYCAQKRPMGRTGFQASVLGIGDLADRTLSLQQNVGLVRRALDAGLNVIDTAPGYEDGWSEQVVGTAVRDHGARESVFVIDKIDHLDAPVAAQVEESLARIQLDYVDAFVLHGLSSREGWEAACAPGGSMHQLEQIIASGRARFRGISSHDPAVLTDAIQSGLCDIVMFAVGPYCDKRYVHEVLPLARERGVATVCFKTYGAGKLLGDTSGYGKPLAANVKPPTAVADKAGGDNSCLDLPRTLPHLSVRECLHYTLSRDPDVTLLGLSTLSEQDVAFSAAGVYTAPLHGEELRAIELRAEKAVRDKGPCWWDPQG